MTQINIIPVVLSGGSGSRLWPLSRMSYPKQFLNLCSTKTMLQDTLLRVSDLNVKNNIVICNEEHRFIVAEQLREINQLKNSRIILEPVGKNTAPAIALACLSSQEDKSNSDETLLLVLAADHVITDPENFLQAINSAIVHALDDKLITFGIAPHKPETGYGYIKKGAQLCQNVYNVAQFVEKPDIIHAQAYTDSGEYFWNSGIFLFKASVFLSELKKYNSSIFSSCQEAMLNVSFDLDFIRPQKNIFEKCPSESIDYAVMEHTSNSVLVTSKMKWSDVGSWTSLWESLQKNEDGNYIKGDVVSLDTSDCYIHSEQGLLAAIGLQDLIIINTADAVLVSNKDNVQDVKKIYDKLVKEGRPECMNHQKVFRPWGSYTILENGLGFQIRKLSIKPGCSIDKQAHYHRAEHWIVVQGTAEVQKNNELILLSENHSTFISPGDIHVVKNVTEETLEIVEIQSGVLINESDIHHFSTGSSL